MYALYTPKSKCEILMYYVLVVRQERNSGSFTSTNTENNVVDSKRHMQRASKSVE